MPDHGFRLYLDQMFRVDVSQALQKEGYDVIRASEVGQARADDKEILQKAISDHRILVTLDGHFGDWVVLPLSEHYGVVRVKVDPTTAENILKLLIPFFRDNIDQNFQNQLVILSTRRSKWVLTA
jgi:predicted nuclease of predicted toxin-antitoxin system